MKKIGIMGDFSATNPTHISTNAAFDRVKEYALNPFTYEWVDSDTIEADFDRITNTYDGFLIAPGSPYKSMSGVLKIIEYARLNKVPTLGNCGGFQHMIIEFARNVLHIEEAEHAETNPYASKLVINPLSCSLKGQELQIDIVDKNSKAFDIFQTVKIFEQYYCNFGLNPDYQQQIHDAGFRISGSDEHKEARIVELEDHPFFIGTLFVPQDKKDLVTPHPLFMAFVDAVEQRASDPVTSNPQLETQNR